MPFAGARPHRSSPHTAHHRLLLLVSFPLLLFSPPQTNPLYKAKNTRETERDKIIRLTASSMGSSGSWFPVPYRRISTGGGVYGRNRPWRGHPKWTQDAQVEERQHRYRPVRPHSSDTRRFGAGLPLAPGGLQTLAWVSPHSGVHFARGVWVFLFLGDLLLLFHFNFL
jgi:hypothetical protein